MQSRKTRQIALDERLHRRQIEASDKHKGEVARVGKAIVVEREGSLEAQLVDTGGLQWPRPKMVLRQRCVQRLTEYRLRQRVLIGQRHLQLFLEDPKRDGIGTRCREREIDELEHRLELFARRAAPESLLGLTDVRIHGHAAAGEKFIEIDAAELAQP